MLLGCAASGAYPGVDPQHAHADMLGEHDDNEVLALPPTNTPLWKPALASSGPPSMALVFENVWPRETSPPNIENRKESNEMFAQLS